MKKLLGGLLSLSNADLEAIYLQLSTYKIYPYSWCRYGKCWFSSNHLHL